MKVLESASSLGRLLVLKNNRRGARGVSQPYNGGTPFNPHLKVAILEVVENQVRAGDPPETRQTFEQLLAAGYSRKEAVEMIGSALVEEIWGMLNEREVFEQVRFAGLLEKLR